MKILLTGANGQVGHELERSMQRLGQVVAPRRADLDLVNLDQLREVIRAVQPDLIVNPAAYTAVDQAESEVALAMRINAEAPAVMATEAKRLGAAIVQYSTDYVFDGLLERPYVESDQTAPLNVYGASKLAGERAIQASGVRHLILRTSWVYGMHGKNFLRTMLRLAAERDSLSIVADQHGAPTWSRMIAQTTAHILAQAAGTGDGPAWWEQHGGLYHLTAQGATTWYGFTQEIMAQAALEPTPQLTPIGTAQYPTPARRPLNSRLSCERLISAFGALPDWKTDLKLCMHP